MPVPTTTLAEPPAAPPATSIVALLAFGAGLSVAAIYYAQPILTGIAASFRASPADVGLVPTLTQLGYGAGIVLFVPLGDRFDRRRVILVKLGFLVAALTAAAIAPTLACMVAASFAIGLSATAAQDFVPAAAVLAAPASRGKTVGTVMTGLLLGILLSRLASGVVGDRLGWRAVFTAAAVAIALLAAVVTRWLPRFPPTSDATYPALMRSLGTLVRDNEPLRRAAVTQGLLSISFSAFWSTLALALAGAPYNKGSVIAGAFGVAGAAGALAAPLAGSLADKRGPKAIIRFGGALVLASFALMGLWQGSLVVLALGAVGFDLGAQSSLIAHQTIIYGLDPGARGRLNAVLVSSMFVGMSTGAALGSYAFAHWGWSGVCALGSGGAVLALVTASLRRAKLA